ncbi:MAG: DUF4442 domain-containing protein [Cytophagales bacterium]|nr:DUF4442 domain-containing protein [Cytophagales bacterium]
MNDQQKKLASKLTNPMLLMFYMFFKLPMGFLAGLRVRKVNENMTVVSVPFKWRNKNPFKSIYFAVQSMAAEMSTASACMLAVQDQSPSVAFIIVDLKGSFSKKAIRRVYFTCEQNQKAFEAVVKCIETGEAAQATFETVGKMKDGTEVARFEFTWSFKQRSA